MRPSLRFLCLAVAGWAGLRAATLGVLPGSSLFRIEPSEARTPPIVPTQFASIDPPPTEVPAYAAAPDSSYSGGRPTRAVYIPIYAPAASAPVATPALSAVLPEPRPHFYSPIPALDEWPLSRIAATSLPTLRSVAAAPAQSIPVPQLPQQLDRLQLTSWALLRNQQMGSSPPQSLAGRGTLGGSQAGARLTYYVSRRIGLTLRTSSEVGRRGGEAAAGVRLQPIASVPVWFTAERRQRIGRFGGGRNAFAFFAEGGVYQRPIAWGLNLDAYLQGGMVGVRSRDGFVDGGMTLTRPVYRQFSAGAGVWGGAQPGVYRVDAGPRVSMRVRDNVKVHFDWRQRLAGKAEPRSGPAVTLAGDF